jgi:hypothetical protein
MSKPYCGSKDIPKGMIRGDMGECIRRGDIRYYGLKTIDPKLRESIMNERKVITKDKLMKKITPLRVVMRKLKDKYEETDDPDVLKKYNAKVVLYNRYVRMTKEIDAAAKKTRVSPQK